VNLHGIAGPIVGAVNPNFPVSVQLSTGPTIAADGTVTPTYSAPSTLVAQIQPITWRDLQQMDGINLGGVRWKVYLYGEIDGIVRLGKKGGDLITISTGRHQGVWLVAQVLEQFPDWCCAAIVLQNQAAVAPSSGLTTDLTNPENEVVVPAVLTGV
jgi:hypothetical protein